MPESGEWTKIIRGALAEILRPVNYREGVGLDIEDVLEHAREIFDSMATCFALEPGDVFQSYRAITDGSALLCDGSTYAIADYPKLAEALDGITWSDATNFDVPDARSRVPIAAGQGSGLTSYAVDDTGGLEDVTLTIGEIPPHTHTYGAYTLATSVFPGELSTCVPYPFSGNTGSAGSGNSHENMPPYIAMNFYIVTGE